MNYIEGSPNHCMEDWARYIRQVYHSEWRHGGIIKGGGNSMEADLKRHWKTSGFKKEFGMTADLGQYGRTV
jgi:hypothetical protein